MPAPLTKTCPMCKETKRMNEFYEDRTKKDKRGGICKSCQLKVNKKSKK